VVYLIISDLDLGTVLEELDKGSVIGEPMVCKLLHLFQGVVTLEENIVVVDPPVVICGDVHGQYEDVKELFKTAGVIQNDFQDRKFIFMGDYVDRGKYSLNTFLLLAVLKLKYPGQFTILRGNHEARSVSQMYGFHAEILNNYGHPGIWNLCMDVFDQLPLCAITDKNVLSVHGGLSPELFFYDDLLMKKHRREIPEKGIMADITWSDPDDSLTLTWRRNSRGAGYVFGGYPVKKFCHANRLIFITRSHQLVQDGYHWYYEDDKKKQSPGRMINVWSAPNYAYQSGNEAAIMLFKFDPGDPYECRRFHDVPENERLKEQDIKVFDYFA
jgi:diadenosine tetraphosphatase ApaH/serine/threonine PP2A family protein phosphatase